MIFKSSQPRFENKVMHITKTDFSKAQEAIIPTMRQAFVDAAAKYSKEAEETTKAEWQFSTEPGALIKYYGRRMSNEQILMLYESGAIEMLRRLPSKSTMWEIGGCFSQLGFLMAAEGWKVVSVDPDPICKKVIEYTKNSVRNINRKAADRITPVTAFFPHLDLSKVRKNDIAVVLGCPIHAIGEELAEEKVEEFRQGLNRFKYVLIDLRMWPRDAREVKDFTPLRETFTEFETLCSYSYEEGFPVSVYFLRHK